MCPCASEGAVASTHSEKVRLDLSFENLGERKVKNIVEPIRAYRNDGRFWMIGRIRVRFVLSARQIPNVRHHPKPDDSREARALVY